MSAEYNRLFSSSPSFSTASSGDSGRMTTSPSSHNAHNASGNGGDNSSIGSASVANVPVAMLQSLREKLADSLRQMRLLEQRAEQVPLYQAQLLLLDRQNRELQQLVELTNEKNGGNSSLAHDHESQQKQQSDRGKNRRHENISSSSSSSVSSLCSSGSDVTLKPFEEENYLLPNLASLLPPPPTLVRDGATSPTRSSIRYKSVTTKTESRSVSPIGHGLTDPSASSTTEPTITLHVPFHARRDHHRPPSPSATTTTRTTWQQHVQRSSFRSRPPVQPTCEILHAAVQQVYQPAYVAEVVSTIFDFPIHAHSSSGQKIGKVYHARSVLPHYRPVGHIIVERRWTRPPPPPFSKQNFSASTTKYVEEVVEQPEPLPRASPPQVEITPPPDVVSFDSTTTTSVKITTKSDNAVNASTGDHQTRALLEKLFLSSDVDLLTHIESLRKSTPHLPPLPMLDTLGTSNGDEVHQRQEPIFESASPIEPTRTTSNFRHQHCKQQEHHQHQQSHRTTPNQGTTKPHFPQPHRRSFLPPADDANLWVEATEMESPVSPPEDGKRRSPPALGNERADARAGERNKSTTGLSVYPKPLQHSGQGRKQSEERPYVARPRTPSPSIYENVSPVSSPKSSNIVTKPLRRQTAAQQTDGEFFEGQKLPPVENEKRRSSSTNKTSQTDLPLPSVTGFGSPTNQRRSPTQITKSSSISKQKRKQVHFSEQVQNPETTTITKHTHVSVHQSQQTSPASSRAATPEPTQVVGVNLEQTEKLTTSVDKIRTASPIPSQENTQIQQPKPMATPRRQTPSPTDQKKVTILSHSSRPEPASSSRATTHRDSTVLLRAQPRTGDRAAGQRLAVKSRPSSAYTSQEYQRARTSPTVANGRAKPLQRSQAKRLLDSATPPPDTMLNVAPGIAIKMADNIPRKLIVLDGPNAKYDFYIDGGLFIKSLKSGIVGAGMVSENGLPLFQNRACQTTWFPKVDKACDAGGLVMTCNRRPPRSPCPAPPNYWAPEAYGIRRM